MEKPDYGLDTPQVVRNLRIIGLTILLLSAVGLILPIGNLRWILFFVLANYGLFFLATSLLMILYSKKGKLRHRDFMLDLHTWRGDETVLDIGTGRGLLAIGAAKRAPRGKVTGIDIWDPEDLSDNSADNARKVVRQEGEASRVEILRDDVRQLSFPDGSFDLVVSNLCLHNLEEAVERKKACLEIIRVLKPGGALLISDFQKIREFQKIFDAAGIKCQRTRSPWFKTLAFPPLSVLRGQKPSA